MTNVLSTQTSVIWGMPLTAGQHDLRSWPSDDIKQKDESGWSDTHWCFWNIYCYLSSFVIKVPYITYLLEQSRQTQTHSLFWHPSGASSQISALVWLLFEIYVRFLLYQWIWYSIHGVIAQSHQTSCISTMKVRGNIGYYIVHANFSCFYIYITHHVMLT